VIRVSIEINRPINVVWDYYTEPVNWVKWWGGGLKEVTPGWQKGAKLIWSLGGSSPIAEIIPQEMLRTSGGFMDHTFTFRASGDSATIVEIIESDPKGGASFSDGGAAQKAKMESQLQKLKSFIENETAAAKSASKTKENKWWQFWKK
jgi:uncharacterized protein YndB with AHSA1/START domain